MFLVYERSLRKEVEKLDWNNHPKGNIASCNDRTHMAGHTCNLQINAASEPVGQNNEKEYLHTQRVSVGLGSG